MREDAGIRAGAAGGEVMRHHRITARYHCAMVSRRLASCVLVMVLAAACRDRPPPPQSSSASTTSASTFSVASAPTAPSGESELGECPAEEPDTRAAIATFWTWFGAHAKALHDDPDLRATMQTISDQLDKIECDVFAEIAQQADTRTLVLTADGKKEHFPLIKDIYAARADAAGWKVVAFRQRTPPAEAMPIEIDGKTLDPKTMKFTAKKNGDKLDIVVFVPGFTTIDDLGSGAFVVLDHTVGEYDLETKIGAIDWQSTKKAPADARPLVELPKMVDEALPGAGQ